VTSLRTWPMRRVYDSASQGSKETNERQEMAGRHDKTPAPRSTAKLKDGSSCRTAAKKGDELCAYHHRLESEPAEAPEQIAEAAPRLADEGFPARLLLSRTKRAPKDSSCRDRASAPRRLLTRRVRDEGHSTRSTRRGTPT
jgi:hypothetical protein